MVAGFAYRKPFAVVAAVATALVLLVWADSPPARSSAPATDSPNVTAGNAGPATSAATAETTPNPAPRTDVAQQAGSPAATADRPVEACAPEDSSDDWFQMPNGFEPAHVRSSGLGSFTVRNGGDDDAIVFLVPAGTEEVARQVYVRRNRSAVLTNIAPIRYSIVFERGRTFVGTTGSFCHSSGQFEFDKVVDFTETSDEDATHYHDYDITLYTVPNGNTRFHPVYRRLRRLPATSTP
jgi:hypothetical protein